MSPELTFRVAIMRRSQPFDPSCHGFFNIFNADLFVC